MRSLTLTSMALLLLLSPTAGCGDDDGGDKVAEARAAAVEAIDWTRLKAHVDTLADDAMGGRIPGSVGHDAARAYLISQLEGMGLEPFGDGGTYVQTYAQAPRAGRYQLTADGEVVPNAADTGYNLVGIVRGQDPALADEYIVLMGHYDHIGVTEDGEIYNGAFDNATGTAALLEVARVMLAADAAAGRSVVFLWSDGEELGLRGADHWISNPPIPKEKIVVGISADPVGRGILTDYGPVLMMGLERSPALKDVFRAAAVDAQGPVTFLHRDIVIGFASDQDTFHDAGIPGVWFINPGMTFYHTVDDTAQTIDYRVLLPTTRYLLQAVYAVGDAPGAFAYQDAPPVTVGDIADARDILNGVLGSTELTAEERARAEGFVADLEAVIAADDVGLLGEDPLSYFLPVALFTAFDLPAAHPGPVPPPTP